MAERFVEALAVLAFDWLDRELPLCLPTSTDAGLALAMSHIDGHLDCVGLGDACEVVGVVQGSRLRRCGRGTRAPADLPVPAMVATRSSWLAHR